MIRRRANNSINGTSSSNSTSSSTDNHTNKGKDKNVSTRVRKIVFMIAIALSCCGCAIIMIGLVLDDVTTSLFGMIHNNNVSNNVSNNSNNSNNNHHHRQRHMHVVFSTDCGSFQHWQSYLLFYSAFKVGQQDLGTVTRIASGCSDSEMLEVQGWHDEHIREAFGTDRFLVHFTPHFSSVKDEDGNVKGDYKFFNKPLGVRHWLDSNLDLSDNDVVALIDPDMILLRRLSWDFSSTRDVIFSGRARENPKYEVEIGVPFGQTYGLGTQWRKFNLDNIAGPDSPAKLVSQEEAFKSYPVGPPYIAITKDFRNIAMKWCEFVPKVHAEYPNLLAEVSNIKCTLC